MTTEQLLAESVQSAREREASTFDTLAARAGRKIVLFGAGTLGRKVLSALRGAGIRPLAFADNNRELQGGAVDGVAVLALEDATARWGMDALFVVTIFRPQLGEGMGERLARLAELGCRRTAAFLPVAWRFTGVLSHFGADLPSRILGNAAELRRVASLLNDDSSREVFRQQLAWRLRGDFSAMSPPTPNQYFPPDLIVPRSDERLVDGGAYDGNTLRCIPNGFAHAWAIEPDPANAARLRSRIDKRVTVYETALGRKSGTTRFDARGTTASSRSDLGKVCVSVSRLDDLLAEEGPTFLKLDVEGDELAALEGGQEILRRNQPVAAVCLYHRPDDLWTIPLFLHEALPGHRIFLRIHEYDGFELVAYAVPPDRCR